MIARAAVAVVLVVVALAGLGQVATLARAEEEGGPAIEPEDGWEEIVAAAAEAARAGRYRGEALLASWESPGSPSVQLVEVAPHGGVVEVSGEGDAPVPPTAPTFPDEAGDVAGGVRVTGVARVPDPAVLSRKYRVSAPSRARVLARPCAVLEIRSREDGRLRERLWVDTESGILLRRESYEGDRLLRLAAFLSVEETAARDPADRPEPSDDGAPTVVTVRRPGIEALRAAGWTIPEELPGGYQLGDVYAHSGGGTPPLQTVYGDGLYALSVFQQRGRPDWGSLPAGARLAEGLGFDAYEWPGAMPRRLVWSGGEATFTLVGDPPPVEFRRIAEALPQEPARSWFDRVVETLRGWWERVTG